MAHSNGLMGNFNKGIIYKNVGRVKESQRVILNGFEDGKSGEPLQPLHQKRGGEGVVTRTGRDWLSL